MVIITSVRTKTHNSEIENLRQLSDSIEGTITDSQEKINEAEKKLSDTQNKLNEAEKKLSATISKVNNIINRYDGLITLLGTGLTVEGGNLNDFKVETTEDN